ncbi:MAG: MATE family efflux transporter, partial [bacterium]
HPRPVLTSPLDGEIQRLYFPALLTLVLEPVQALTDSVVVGRIGTPQLGALGLGTAVFQFVLGLFSVFIFATTTVVAEENAAMRSGDAGCAREDSGEGAGTRSEVGDSPATSDFHSTAGVASESSAVYRGTTLAVLVGVFLQLAILELSPAIMHVVSSADATIANLSNEYVHSRAYAAVPALVMMVGCGASRGHKDPWTPLLGSVAYGVSLAVFDVYFVWGCRMGLEGAGYAASISQWIGAATVLLSLRNNGTFRLEDFLSARSIPTASFVAPYLRMAGPLALSSSAALAPVLLSSSMATGLGPDQLAAHTVLRQISTFWIQLFMGFNATAHSLVASALGKRTIQGVLEGSRVVERTACVAVAASLPLATGLYLCREWLPLPFTDSGVVVNDVIEVLPLLLAIAPLDALSLAFEGSILGASDTTWIAQRSIASSSLSILALEALSGTESCSLFSIWACLALLRGGVLAGDVTRLVWPVRFK